MFLHDPPGDSEDQCVTQCLCHGQHESSRSESSRAAATAVISPRSQPGLCCQMSLGSASCHFTFVQGIHSAWCTGQESQPASQPCAQEAACSLHRLHLPFCLCNPATVGVDATWWWCQQLLNSASQTHHRA